MAGTGAVTKLTLVIGRVRVLVLLVRAGIEITEMAPGTVGLIGGERPGHDLRVTAMTVRTRQLLTMVTGIPR